MATESLDAFDEAVIAVRQAAVDRGEKPCALAVGWIEHRDIEAESEEVMIQLVVLDGHHTLEASVRSDEPARALVLFPWAYSWVP
ncbi:unnamed protein product, partial [Laminaria digitata]